MVAANLLAWPRFPTTDAKTRNTLGLKLYSLTTTERRRTKFSGNHPGRRCASRSSDACRFFLIV